MINDYLKKYSFANDRNLDELKIILQSLLEKKILGPPKLNINLIYIENYINHLEENDFDRSQFEQDLNNFIVNSDLNVNN